MFPKIVPKPRTKVLCAVVAPDKLLITIRNVYTTARAIVRALSSSCFILAKAASLREPGSD
jgi:hypothetical protein